MTDTRPSPQIGDVWSYLFLWSREADHGETEGRKHRPCALALLRRNVNGKVEVLLLPITLVFERHHVDKVCQSMLSIKDETGGCYGNDECFSSRTYEDMG